MAVSLSTLLVRETKAAIYAKGLQVGAALGLPVTSWHAGDPTRSLYHYLAEVLEVLEQVVASFVAAGFLDHATGAWLTLLAKQVFGVDRVEAVRASCTVRLSNAKGGVYTFEVGELVVRNSTSGKLFRNSTSGTLASGPGTTLDLTFEAEEAGSESSSAIGEIDEMVTVHVGVTCASTTVATGVDEESDAALRVRCREKLGALSPNGPRDAYAFVARSAELTGTSAVTRVRVYDDSDTGDVEVLIAGPSGGVDSTVVDAVEDAIVRWATPLCVTPSVESATSAEVDVTFTLWVYARDGRSAAELEEAAESALEQLFAAKPIGGDIIPPATTGALYRSHIESVLRAVSEDGFRVVLAAPPVDVSLARDEVPALGTVAATIHLVSDP